MRVDKDSLGAILKNVEAVEQSNFDFAVEAIVEKDSILPMLSVEGVGIIPVPVSIKVNMMHFWVFWSTCLQYLFRT